MNGESANHRIFSATEEYNLQIANRLTGSAQAITAGSVDSDDLLLNATFMRVAGFLLMFIGIAVVAVSIQDLSLGLEQGRTVAILGGLLAAFMGIILWQFKPRRGGFAWSANILQAMLRLFVHIPIVVFSLGLIPTLIGSFFLPSGQSQWIMYGIAVVATPLLVWGWWINTKMIFSRNYRRVGISDPEAMAKYDQLPEMAKTDEPREIKTKERREGTTKAKLRSFGGHTFYMSVYLVMVALTRIPLAGLLFSPLKVWFERLASVKMDALRQEVKRLEAPTMKELTEADPRPPVLLLRSFQDDGYEMESLESEDKNTNTITFEELICREVAGWGPVVAIGQPGEKMPQLGAARAYYTNETWQENALEMLDNSHVVLMVMGSTPSVGWELERIFDRKHLSKTIVLLPPADLMSILQRLLVFKGVYERKTGRIFELQLPKGDHPLAIVFGEDGKLLTITGPFQVSLAYLDALRLASKVIQAHKPQVELFHDIR